MPHQVKRVSESTFLFFFTSYVSSTSVTQGGLSFFRSFVLVLLVQKETSTTRQQEAHPKTAA
jgi:hypothetical protein